jgi:hypothetical protein
LNPINPNPLAEKLYKENLISDISFQQIKLHESSRLFSIGLELRTLLYAGILLLTTGLSIAVYKNIDSIGHMAVIVFMACITLASYYYCYKKKSPFSVEKVKSPDIFFDYVLLLGSLTCVSFIAYLQFQYAVFGAFDGASFLLSAIILFTAAYYFDHSGVLTMAITSFAAFAGITISPRALFESSSTGVHELVYTGLTLGALLVVSSLYLSSKNIKKHFTFTYLNIAAHLLFIFVLTGLFDNGNLIIFTFLFFTISLLALRYALTVKSFYYLLITVIYGYIGITWLFFKVMFAINAETLGVFLFWIYFIVTSVYIISYLKNSRKKMQIHDHL